MLTIKDLIGAITGLTNLLLSTFCIGVITAGGRPDYRLMYVIIFLTIVCLYTSFSSNTSKSK